MQQAFGPNSMIKVSVITVTYNALPALQRTLQSVVGQEHADFEYIVVDGGSKDGTREYLEKHSDKIARWVSEPDDGIYSAMNKGVQMAEGEYCIFMNADDCFVDKRVLCKITPFLVDGIDILLGNAIYVNGEGKILAIQPSRSGFSLSNIFQTSVCHQACFIKRKLLIEHPYNEAFRLVSDWEFILERVLDGKTICGAVNRDVCFFMAGGATDKYRTLGIIERRSVLERYPDYRPVWEEPYNPPFWRKAGNRLALIVKRIQYASKVNI